MNELHEVGPRAEHRTDVRNGRRAPFHWWALLAVGFGNVAAASYTMLGGSRMLRSFRPAGASGVDIGQGPFETEGLTQGAASAFKTLQTWKMGAGSDAASRGVDLAGTWLAVDTWQFALGGYGLVSLMTVLIAHRAVSRIGRNERPAQVPKAWRVAGVLGLLLTGWDLVENWLTGRVIDEEGAGPAAFLHVWWILKWWLAAATLLAAVVAIVAWCLVPPRPVLAWSRAGIAWLSRLLAVGGARRSGRDRGVSVRSSDASSDVRVQGRLRDWARALGWNLLVLVVSIGGLATLAGVRAPRWAVGLTVALFAGAALRFNAVLEQRYRSDQHGAATSARTARLIIGAGLVSVGASLAYGFRLTGGRTGVGFVGVALALFGASSLLGELRWARARWRPWFSLACVAAALATGWIALWRLDPVPGAVAFGLAVFGFGVVGLSTGSEDALRWLAAPGAGDDRPPEAPGWWNRLRRAVAKVRRDALFLLPVAGVLIVVGTVAAMKATGWGTMWVVVVVGALALLAFATTSNWAGEAVIAIGALALVWALAPGSKPNDDFLEPKTGDRVMIVMGDSYSSGEGAKAYYEGTNTSEAGIRNKCRRAPTAYGPTLVSDGLSLDAGAPIDSIAFLACSGADIVHVAGIPVAGGKSDTGSASKSESVSDESVSDESESDESESAPGGQYGEPTQLARAAAVRDAVGRKAIELVLVGISGNDAGFGTVIAECIVPGECTSRAARRLETLAATGPRLAATYKAIRATLGDGPRYVAVPYPVPLAEASCGESLFSDAEHAYLVAYTHQINSVMRQAAQRSGWEFADTVADVFVDSESGLCMGGSGAPSMNHVAPSQEFGVLEDQVLPTNWLHNSMHPTAAGHERVAAALADWLRNNDRPEASADTGGSVGHERYDVATAADVVGEASEQCPLNREGATGRCGWDESSWLAGSVLGAVRANLALLSAGFVGAALVMLWASLLFRWRRSIGSLAWAKRRGGRLQRVEKFALVVPLVSAGVAFGVDWVTRRVRTIPPLRWLRRRRSPGGVAPRPAGASVDAIDAEWERLLVGKSEDERAALGAVRAHCVRAWQFGLALAAEDNVELDPEAFYVAALGHDLGLVDRLVELGSDLGASCGCFTLVGAELSRAAAGQLGGADGGLDVLDAITNHITPSLSRAHDHPLAVYLQWASLLDLTGFRKAKLSARFYEDVNATHPSTGREVLADAWEREAKHVDGRARLINLARILTRLIRARRSA